MAGTGGIRSSPKSELILWISKKRAASAALGFCADPSVHTIRLVDEDRSGHAVAKPQAAITPAKDKDKDEPAVNVDLTKGRKDSATNAQK